MEILPDPIHAALLVLPFVVAALAMHAILWRPLLDYLEERDHTASKARHETHELDHAASEQLGRIEARLTQARHHVGDPRAEARGRALVAEGVIVAAARTEAEGRVVAAVEQIRTERRSASETLRNTASELASDIAAQVLGRPVA